MATSTLITDTSKEAKLEWVLCIQYLVQFCQNHDEDKNKNVSALIDSGSEINIMYPAYATKLGFLARKIDVGVKKIDRSHLDTFEIVIADCSVKKKLGKVSILLNNLLVG